MMITHLLYIYRSNGVGPVHGAQDAEKVILVHMVLSAHNTAGHVEFRKKGLPTYWEYSLESHQWMERATVTLRPQEKQVLILSAQGYTVPQIADKMCRALDTVKTYKRALFERLGVRSITEALTVATNQGLL